MANFHLKTQYKETEVVTGATIELSLGDAKTILKLTDTNPVVTQEMVERDPHITTQRVLEQNAETLRLMMQEIAQKVLDTGITTTDPEELFYELVGKPMSDVYPA